MKKTTLCLIILMFSYISNAQFKTEYNQSGDPKTEKIDASSMKQGEWIYYNNENQIIRIDTFTDNELIKRNCFLNNVEVNMQNLVDYDTKKIVTNQLLKNVHGEALVDELGKLVTVSIYYNNQDKTTDKKNSLLLKSFLKNVSKSNKKTIIIF